MYAYQNTTYMSRAQQEALEMARLERAAAEEERARAELEYATALQSARRVLSPGKILGGGLGLASGVLAMRFGAPWYLVPVAGVLGTAAGWQVEWAMLPEPSRLGPGPGIDSPPAGDPRVAQAMATGQLGVAAALAASHAKPNFDPLSFGLNYGTQTAISTAATQATTPAKKGVSAETVADLTGQGMGLASSIISLFGPRQQPTPASAPQGTDPAVLAMLAQQEQSASQTRTLMLVGGGVGLLVLTGIGAAVIYSSRKGRS